MEGIEIANISIPLIKGDTGSAGKIKSISVVMLSPTATAYATNTGTESEAIITLGIPQGASVTSANIVNGDLIITLNNGQTLNAGNVVGTGVVDVDIDSNYDFIVTLSDGSVLVAGNLQILLSGMLSTKVDKVEGKGLSTNDYTTAEKTKLSGIESGAEENTIEVIKVNGTAQTITNKEVNLVITQPTKLSDLTNDTGFITNSVSNLTNYYTETEINTTLSDYATKTYVDTLIGDIDSALDAINGEEV